MILKLFRPSSPDRNIRDLYGAIVAQARLPAFYTGYGVPDTVQGRFDLIVLHLVLVIAQIGRRSGTAERMTAPRAPSDKNCSTNSAAISTTISARWGSAISRCRSECGASPRRFTAARPLISRLLAAADPRELENALARNIFDEVKAGGGGAGAACRLCPRDAVAVRDARQSRIRQRAAAWTGRFSTSPRPLQRRS